MLNYIHSELYRAAHNKGLKKTVAVLTGLGILLHVALWLFAANAPNFHYATTSYSYSILVSSPEIFRAAAFLIVGMLYESDRKNGIDKNSLAFGISRTRIFLGKCVAGLAACTMAMVVVLVVYIGSAALLLSQSGPVMLGDLLGEAAAVFPAAVSSMILSVALLTLFEKSTAAALTWGFLLFILPRIAVMLGMALQTSLQWDGLLQLAARMPQNVFAMGMEVNLSQCITAWSTSQGMVRCLLSGAAGCILFTLFGIAALRKKDF